LLVKPTFELKYLSFLQQITFGNKKERPQNIVHKMNKKIKGKYTNTATADTLL